MQIECVLAPRESWQARERAGAGGVTYLPASVHTHRAVSKLIDDRWNRCNLSIYLSIWYITLIAGSHHLISQAGCNRCNLSIYLSIW